MKTLEIKLSLLRLQLAILRRATGDGLLGAAGPGVHGDLFGLDDNRVAVDRVTVTMQTAATPEKENQE